MASRITKRLDLIEAELRRQHGGVYVVSKMGDDLYRLVTGEVITGAELNRLAEYNDGIHPILICDGPWNSVRSIE